MNSWESAWELFFLSMEKTKEGRLAKSQAAVGGNGSVASGKQVGIAFFTRSDMLCT